MSRVNDFLSHGLSEESDANDGYDSEAAEPSKGARTVAISGRDTKRRKLSHSEDEELAAGPAGITQDARFTAQPFSEEEDDVQSASELTAQKSQSSIVSNGGTSKHDGVPLQINKKKDRSNKKATKPGVIYLSSLPPYLKPSALRNLLIQRGFSPIRRLFLTPASKAKSNSSSKKNSRQLYSEGWIEFENKKTARRCTESLNAQIIGGKKGGFYYDDLWNMKYLKGMGWDELMAGIREERREEEGRRDEERRTIANETKRFVEGVEEGKRLEGIKRKREGKAAKSKSGNGVGDPDAAQDLKRTWRQFEVKGKDGMATKKSDRISDDVKEVLGKIF